MAYQCRIEADSLSAAGKRITTFVSTYPRMVHSELMTHRMFSRNSSSSRAIPIEKMIEQVETDPVIPVWWGKNQSGMQAREELDAESIKHAKAYWLDARNKAVASAKMMIFAGAHKQIVNRLLEPWMWITVVITSTEFDNFFRLRCHIDAQPEIERIASMMRDAYQLSTPVMRDYHYPFYRPDLDGDIPISAIPRVCVARCARVSYLTHDGQRDWQKDTELASRLADSGHWSPYEHVAWAASDRNARSGNFIGWKQFRAGSDPNFIHYPEAGEFEPFVDATRVVEGD